MLLRWHRPELIGVATMSDVPGVAQMGSGSNPLFQYETDRLKNIHRLDDLMANDKCLKRLLFVELYFLMIGHDVPEKDVGPCFGKNAQSRTSVYFNKSTGRLTIHGTKTYSRRSESKSRTYPAQWLAKRLEWFLKQSQYVESFKRAKGHPEDVMISFDIKFKSCYTAERIKMIEKRKCLTEKTSLNFLIHKLEFAIENYDSLENLKSRLANAIELRDNAERKFKSIQIN